ncbi:MAG: methyltransferase domain-containing protein [Rhodobacter sp.]|nr:methyltransferase domain-containing protein [Rhodobacter sp.]
MSRLSDLVIDHYDTGAMLDRIRAGLAEAGTDPDRPKPEDLKPVDEFHTGGLEATEALLGPLGITSDMRVLDIGCGIGGTARFVASRYGANVTGIDLTPAFVHIAEELSAMCGLGDRTQFSVASVFDLPVADGSADLVTMFHVGMNIDDKPALFREVARVLPPGGRFALFDIMELSGAPVDFPVPWASAPEASFLAPPQAYRDAASAAGLVPVFERDRTAYAVAFFERVTAAMDEHGPPPVGLQLIMGPTAQARYGNAVRAAFDGKTGPWEMVFGKG